MNRLFQVPFKETTHQVRFRCFGGEKIQQAKERAGMLRGLAVKPGELPLWTAPDAGKLSPRSRSKLGPEAWAHGAEAATRRMLVGWGPCFWFCCFVCFIFLFFCFALLALLHLLDCLFGWLLSGLACVWFLLACFGFLWLFVWLLLALCCFVRLVFLVFVWHFFLFAFVGCCLFLCPSFGCFGGPRGHHGSIRAVSGVCTWVPAYPHWTFEALPYCIFVGWVHPFKIHKEIDCAGWDFVSFLPMPLFALQNQSTTQMTSALFFGKLEVPLASLCEPYEGSKGKGTLSLGLLRCMIQIYMP